MSKIDLEALFAQLFWSTALRPVTLNIALFVAIFVAPLLAGAPALAGGLVDAGEFGDVTPSTTASSASSQAQDNNAGSGANYNSGRLSGQVSVSDSIKAPTTRLGRGRGGGSGGQNGDPQAGSVEDSVGRFLQKNGPGLQSLFPSLDNSQPAASPALAGAASQSAAVKGRPIWQKSIYGGYYDASGLIRDVIKGNQLYKYGGTMADGLTPAPTGPVEQNSMGYIKWQPVTGGPPGWY